MEKQGLSLLSCFPRQVVEGLEQMLIVPLMNWFLLTLLPLRMVYLSSMNSFVAANGQFMAFKREAYVAVGGHRSVRGCVVEDMELARAIKRNGMKMMTMLGGKGISCSMYGSLKEGMEGFSKNFYPGFNMPAGIFFVMLAFIVMLFLAPFLAVLYNKIFLIFIAVIIFQRLALSVTVGENPLAAVLLHPLQMLIMAAVGINSIRLAKNGGTMWKGRYVQTA